MKIGLAIKSYKLFAKKLMILFGWVGEFLYFKIFTSLKALYDWTPWSEAITVTSKFILGKEIGEELYHLIRNYKCAIYYLYIFTIIVYIKNA